MTLEGFREHLERTESPRTVLAYTPDVERFEAFRAGRPVSVDVLEGWVDSLNHGRLKPQTVGRKLAAVRRWLAFLARHGVMDAMATLTVLQAGYQVVRGPRQADRRHVAPMTAEEYREARARAPEWCRHLMGLLWHTGARISEVLGDGLAGIPALTVHSAEELARRGHTSTVGKGMKRRVLVLPAVGRAELASWLDGRGPNEPLFPSPADSSRPISKQSFNTALHRAGIASGAHRLRHSFKVRLRQGGTAEEIIRALLGHGPRDVTDQYGRVSVEEMQGAAERLASLEEDKS